jgi:predicted cupin superfamily sugar epimerase
MSETTIQTLVEIYGMKPHPEGGFYAETYRSKENIPRSGLPSRFSGSRSISTAIFFLLPRGHKSCLHRIQSDEVWHFYLGDPLIISQIHGDGRVEEIVLGNDITKGQRPQFVVPAGSWFGSAPIDGGTFSFVGCTVAPGFDFQDFEMATRENMLKHFPHAETVILKLTNPFIK